MNTFVETFNYLEYLDSLYESHLIDEYRIDVVRISANDTTIDVHIKLVPALDYIEVTI